MPKVFNFKVIVEQDEEGVFVASVPAIPGCHTQGGTYEDALDNIKEAIELCLEEAKADRRYRGQISWPEEQSSKFLGIADVSVRAPSFT